MGHHGLVHIRKVGDGVKSRLASAGNRDIFGIEDFYEELDQHRRYMVKAYIQPRRAINYYYNESQPHYRELIQVKEMETSKNKI